MIFRISWILQHNQVFTTQPGTNNTTKYSQHNQECIHKQILTTQAKTDNTTKDWQHNQRLTTQPKTDNTTKGVSTAKYWQHNQRQTKLYILFIGLQFLDLSPTSHTSQLHRFCHFRLRMWSPMVFNCQVPSFFLVQLLPNLQWPGTLTPTGQLFPTQLYLFFLIC